MRDNLVGSVKSGEGFLVVLLGERGTRKTQLAVSVTDHASADGRRCRCIKALDLFRIIRGAFTPVARGQAGESEAHIIDQLTRYDLQLIAEAQLAIETCDSDARMRTSARSSGKDPRGA